MRNFKFKDGKFTFSIFTDDATVVVAKLSPKKNSDCDFEFVGKSILKENDKFDLHYGMHIAIRNCMSKMKSELFGQLAKIEKKLNSDLGNMKYYSRDTFVEFRKRRLAKIERSKNKQEAK